MATDSQTLISNDVKNVDALITANSNQSAILSAHAITGMDLGNAILSSPQFATLPTTFTLILDGHRDYLSNSYSTTWNVTTTSPYYGVVSDYRGNLKDFTISDGTHTAVTYDSITSSVVYNSTGVPVVSGGTTKYIPLSSFSFMVQQFQFITQYLWADPTNSSLSSLLSSNDASSRGVFYNANTLMRAATALQSANTFYANKKTYLTPLTQ